MQENIRIKMCGLSRPEDIETANRLLPEYIGFVFWPKSRRYVTPERAEELKSLLDPRIQAVGVFVDEEPELIAFYLEQGIIDLAQLHGSEDDACVERLKALSVKPLIQAFRIHGAADLERAERSPADYVLLDAGMGDGRTFDWSLIRDIGRAYFLAGGLSPENVSQAAESLRPFAVDVSSGIETDGRKDPLKMQAFAEAVRKESIT